MERARSILGGTLPAVLFLASCMAHPASATVIYSYTGNPFTTITDANPPAGTYTTDMRVTGWFELAEELPPDWNAYGYEARDIRHLVLDYSFSDGRQILTPANSSYGRLFAVRTDENREILSWQLDLRTVSETRIALRTNTDTDIEDTGLILDVEADQWDYAEVTRNPGTWMVTSVPEPASAALLGAGALGLFALPRRRAGAAAPPSI
ncbi:MAG: PEP-CTERM sorting domain-containing protein [Myxococcota bacterium]